MLLSCLGHDEKSSPAPKCQGLDQSLTWQIASAKVLVIFHFHHNKSFPLFVRFMDITSYLLHIREFPAGGRDLHWKTHVHVLNLWCQISTWILQIQEEPNLLSSWGTGRLCWKSSWFVFPAAFIVKTRPLKFSTQKLEETFAFNYVHQISPFPVSMIPEIETF